MAHLVSRSENVEVVDAADFTADVVISEEVLRDEVGERVGGVGSHTVTSFLWGCWVDG